MAETVLDDCEVALKLLEDEDDPVIWRVHWVGALALLRAVGHVLHNVDGAQHPELRQRIRSKFLEWKGINPTHRIFREFIEQERNSILKEYTTTAHETGVLPILLENFPMKNSDDAGERFQSMNWLSEDIYRPRVSGFKAGDDVRDIYREAIEWWRIELTEILTD